MAEIPRSLPADPVAQSPQPGTPATTTLAFAVVIVASLYIAREALIPIALAVLLSFVLAPLVARLRKLKIPKIPAVLLSVLLALGIVLGIGSIIGTQIASLATELPLYQTTIEKKLGAVRELTVDRIAQLAAAMTRQINPGRRAAEAEQSIARGEASGADASARPPMQVEIRQPAPSPIELAELYLSPLIHPLTTLGIIFVVAIFMLAQKEDLRDRMIRLFGSGDLHRSTAAIDEAAKRLSRYFLLQLCLNSAFGLVVGGGLWLIGVPSPALWGVVATLMRFVPYVGAILSAALPVALAAAVDPDWTMVLWTIALFGVAETLMGQVIEPLVYGHSTGLSATAVIVSAIFWTWLWGPIGLILATPLTLCLVVLGRYVERLEFLDVLLGDRPALTPGENFYQRILAGDPDEALDYAERLLKERSLSSYYDDVVLKGLQLAANDLQRGVLDAAQVGTIRTATQSVVRDLDAFDDIEPAGGDLAKEPAPLAIDEVSLANKSAPPRLAPADLAPNWQGDAPVLCIAGRGSLDEAASEMLAQLLRKHGLGARLVPHAAASRDSIDELDTAGVAMICISYLEIAGNPAHLRYLLRRLRRRFESVPILVGLWPAEDAILTDTALRQQVGADFYTASLRDAVEACMAEAGKHADDAEKGRETMEQL